MSSLLELLAEGVRFDPHYLPSMNSDHLPMTLCAMTALGADEAELARYRNEYSRILRPLAPAGRLDNWQDGVGDMDQYPALLGYFQNQIDKQGIATTVSSYLPLFTHSLIAGAFHPLIRLAYAVDFNSPAETAAALAYMAASSFPVPVDPSQSIALGDLLASQAAQPVAIGGIRFGPEIHRLLDADLYPVGIAVNFADCAAHALDIYRGTRNFFALHMVTATQAARICTQFADEKLILASLTGALLAAHRAVGSPPFDRLHPLPAPSRLDHEHSYKYVYACVSEYKVYNDPRYLEEIDQFRQQGLIAEWAARDMLS